MKTIIILVAILGLTLSTRDISGAERVQMVDAFKALIKTDMGKDLFTTIQLELSTANKQNVVDKIVDMLQKLQDSISENKEEHQKNLDNLQSTCDSKTQGLDTEITELKDKIARADVTFPTLQESIDNKKFQVDTKKTEQNANNEIIAALDEQDVLAKERFQKTRQEHVNMIDGLNEAKKLIQQLQVKKNMFLQQNGGDNRNIMAQIEEHFAKAPKTLVKKHNRSMFGVLLSLAKDVQVHSDQNKVKDILDIIDQLINHEMKTSSLEKDIEQRRQARYQYDRKRAQQNNDFIDAEVKDLQGGLKTAETRYKELQSDLVSWKQHVSNKKTQIKDTQQACDDQIQQHSRGIKQSENNFDLIQQIIQIFQTKQIQDIKAVVGDLKY